MEALFIKADPDGYTPAQCGGTFTVGELKELLESYNDDMPIYLKFNNGYSYGSISDLNFDEAEISND